MNKNKKNTQTKYTLWEKLNLYLYHPFDEIDDIDWKFFIIILYIFVPSTMIAIGDESFLKTSCIVALLISGGFFIPFVCRKDCNFFWEVIILTFPALINTYSIVNNALVGVILIILLLNLGLYLGAKLRKKRMKS